MSYREELCSIGERILEETRTELYLGMRFWDRHWEVCP